MDRSSAGISGQYATSDNGYHQPNGHAPSSRRGRYRHATVRQQDSHPCSTPGCNEFHPFSGTHPSQYLMHRSVNSAQDFNALIKPEVMAGLARKSNRFGHRYDGRNHGQYASSIKKYTSAAKRPLNQTEQSQLMPLLQNFAATRSWNWRSLTTTFHSLTSAGVFTLHKPMDARVKLTQANLLSTLFDSIIFNCNQKPPPRDIDAQGVANLLWAMAKLVDNGLEPTAELKKAVAALLHHVSAKKDQFNAQAIANLLWAMAKLVDNEQKQTTPGLNEAVAALLPLVNAQKDQFIPQHITNLLWAMAKLVDHGQEQTQELNEAVAALLPLVNAQKDQFIPQHIANLLWAMAKLGELVELNVVTSSFESLVYRISENPQLPQQDISMSLWGVMVCCARLSLVSNTNKNNVLEKHMDDLLTRLDNASPDNEEDQSIMIMAAIWLGRPCLVVRHYQTAISKTQAEFRNRLQSSIPSLKIEEEKSLNSLPPVDLLLPDHNVVIEIQGPSHYVGGDFKTRNGSTLLKIALLQKSGFEVIEIPVNQLWSPDSIKRCIDQIKIRVDILEQRHGSVPHTQTRGAGEPYVTDDKGWQDHCDLTTEGHSEEQTGKSKSRKKKRKKRPVTSSLPS
ncbi:RAP domain-containing protein [Endozoicomonas acroporae]|uniref:RAP domain-containing protein n=2 Tax=Endozoicomonas acroporae TaxID=1701104 RepID=UPI0013CFA3B9|nr:RAP domain-containing protein [Endozoicomonas acroporae]